LKMLTCGLWPWSTSPRRLARAVSEFGSEVARLLAERGISLRQAARLAHYDVSYLSKVVSGRKPGSRELAEALDRVLGAGGQLVTLARNPDPPALSDVELIDLARQAEASDLGNGTLELLAMATGRMCRGYPVADSADLSARAARHLRYVTKLLGGRVTLAQHRELLVTAGWLAALLACTCYDAGDAQAAEAARVMARQFGEQAGHGELVAWSFEIAAWYALVEGRYRQTVELSEAGLEHAGVTSAAVQLALQAARGYARMSDPQAREMLAAGHAVLGRLPAPEHPEHHFVFDHGKFEFYVATILTWLGDDATAREHAEEVVRQCEAAGGWPTRLSTTLVNLGMLAGRHGDLDEAVSHGIAALRLPHRSAELLPRSAELRRALAARYPGERLVARYDEALAEDARLGLPRYADGARASVEAPRLG
jgi:transcriptional regulator with XRE-family HTH domain